MHLMWEVMWGKEEIKTDFQVSDLGNHVNGGAIYRVGEDCVREGRMQ